MLDGNRSQFPCHETALQIFSVTFLSIPLPCCPNLRILMSVAPLIAKHEIRARKNIIGMGCKYRMCTNRILSRLPTTKKGNNGFCRFAADIC